MQGYQGHRLKCYCQVSSSTNWFRPEAYANTEKARCINTKILKYQIQLKKKNVFEQQITIELMDIGLVYQFDKKKFHIIILYTLLRPYLQGKGHKLQRFLNQSNGRE